MMDLVLANPYRSGRRNTPTELAEATRGGWELPVVSHRSIPCCRSWRGLPRGKDRMVNSAADGFRTRRNGTLG